MLRNDSIRIGIYQNKLEIVEWHYINWLCMAERIVHCQKQQFHFHYILNLNHAFQEGHYHTQTQAGRQQNNWAKYRENLCVCKCMYIS